MYRGYNKYTNRCIYLDYLNIIGFDAAVFYFWKIQKGAAQKMNNNVDIDLTEYENNLDAQIEGYEEQIYIAIRDFMQKLQIEDLVKEPQNRWNACLIHIGQTVFKDKSKLKAAPYIHTSKVTLNGNAYNIDLFNKLCNIYINICYQFDKEVSIIGYSYFLNISYNTIYDWNNKGENNSSKLNIKSSDIFKKIKGVQEETLANMAISGKRNPVGVLAKLNHKFDWVDKRTVTHEQIIYNTETVALDDLASKYKIGLNNDE